MAKLSRLLFGGVVGAGLAYLFSRKEVRRRLLGGGQPQLTAAPGTPSGTTPPMSPPVSTPSPVAPPENIAPPATQPEREPATAPPPAADAVDLEARIEETRRQIAEQMEEPLTQTTAAPVAAGEEIEATTEPVMEEEIEVSMEVVEVVESAAVAEPEELDEIAALSTPVAGEPELEEKAELEAELGLKPELEAEPVLKPELEAEPPVETAADSAVSPAPSEINRDDMRRRIDETRARLKAKAFDAMVSGETLASQEADEVVTSKSDAAAGIDKDLEEQIDRSLREED